MLRPTLGLLAAALAVQVAAASSTSIYVACFGSDRVLRFDGSSCSPTVVAEFPAEHRPRGLAADQSGTLYVSLRGGPRNVQRISPMPDGTYIVDPFTEAIGSFGPGDVEVASSGNLLVGGGSTGRVHRFDTRTGAAIDSFSHWDCCAIQGVLAIGQHGYGLEFFQSRAFDADLTTSPPETDALIDATPLLSEPWGMTLGHDGSLVIGSQQASVVQRFDPTTGAYLGPLFDLATIGLSGCADIEYSEALGLYVVSSDDLYLLEPGGALVDVYSSPLMTQPYGIAFAQYGPVCAADVDESGDIGLPDLLVVIAQWGECPAACFADLTCDGFVDLDDLLAVLASWGPCA